MDTQVWSSGKAIFTERTAFCSMGSWVGRPGLALSCVTNWMGVLCWLFSLSWCLLSYGFEVLTSCMYCSAVLDLTTRRQCQLHRSKAESPTTYPCSRHKTQVWSPQVTCTFDQLAVNLHDLVIFINLLDWLSELQKVLSLWLQFYYKGQNSGPAKEKGTRNKVWVGPKCRVSVPFPMESGYVTSHTLMGYCPQFLWGAYYRGMIDWILGHMIKLNLNLSLLLEAKGWADISWPKASIH